MNSKAIFEQISLEKKTAVITGAGSGIGREMAKRFFQAGAKLHLLDLNQKGLDETKKIISDKSDKIELFSIDLSSKGQIDSYWEKIDGKIPEILVNNAGTYPFENYLNVTKDGLERTLSINLKSVFWMCQNFIRKKKRNGIIVNISSIEAILPFKDDLIPYCISKSGVISLTRSLARDYGKKGFRSNVILPGAIKTPGTSALVWKAINEMQFKLMKTGYDFQQRLTKGHWGTPDDVAKVTLFLSSDLASYVQGAMIPVDGGFLSS